MSITQTYYLAHTARGKLSSEAARADHDLRLLVGHANLLDSLMLELAEAEQEQESWFNQSVRGATRSEEAAEPKHIQWAETVVEEPEEDWQAEDVSSESDSDSEYDEDAEMDAASMSLHRVTSRQIPSADYESDEDEYEDDGAEDYAALSLTPSPSHHASPPELSHDSDEESSEDESMPLSPPTTTLPSFSEKQRQQIATTSFYEAEAESKPLSPEDQKEFLEEGFFIPQRQSPGLASVISVY